MRRRRKENHFPGRGKEYDEIVGVRLSVGITTSPSSGVAF